MCLIYLINESGTIVSLLLIRKSKQKAGTIALGTQSQVAGIPVYIFFRLIQKSYFHLDFP